MVPETLRRLTQGYNLRVCRGIVIAQISILALAQNLSVSHDHRAHRDLAGCRSGTGLLESQFRGYFHRAAAAKGKTGERLLQDLELRLDNVVFRMGFADTRAEARQLVRHGHFQVNGKRVNIPSFEVKPGTVIEVAEKSRKMIRIAEALETVDRRGVPQWIELDKKAMKGTVKSVPNREDLTMPIQEQLIVELYSK